MCQRHELIAEILKWDTTFENARLSVGNVSAEERAAKLKAFTKNREAELNTLSDEQLKIRAQECRNDPIWSLA